MTTQPTTPREHDPDELTRFKQSIDLVSYAQHRYGYHIDKERSSSVELSRQEEKLVVTRKGDHQVYLNPHDERDQGSIIDFVKARGGGGAGLNLGQVRQELRDYLGQPQPERQSPISGPPRSIALAPNESEAERRARLVLEVLGVQPQLTDRSYLHKRGLTDETIDNPAFQGRVFTAQQNGHRNVAFPLYNERGIASVEQKNEGFRQLLAVPKDGIFATSPTEGKGTKVERVVISESALDSMSYHQLKQDTDRRNTIYVATTGTPTERQMELIQRVIDKHQPHEAVLANDKDAGGRRFNINYLNELQPPRTAKELEGHSTYEDATRSVQWHATAVGKYHSALRVSFQHEKAHEGATHVRELTERVGRINATQDGENSMSMQVQRTGSKETVVRLVVPNADTGQLEVIAQELYRQREAQRAAGQEKVVANFLRVEYPLSKDYNQDIELKNKGLSAAEISRQGQFEAEQKQAQQAQKQQAEALQQQQRQEAQRREAERQQAENSPEVLKARQQQERTTVRVLVGSPVATSNEPPVAVRATPTLEEVHQQFKTAATVVARELEEGGQGVVAARLREVVRVIDQEPHLTGASRVVVGHALDSTEKVRGLADSPQTEALRAAVRILENPGLQGEKTMTSTATAASVHVSEQPAADVAAVRQRRQEDKAFDAAVQSIVAGNSQQKAMLLIDEERPAEGKTTQAQQIAKLLQQTGAFVGELQATLASGRIRTEVAVTYDLRQEQAPVISQTLDALEKTARVIVTEREQDKTLRRDPQLYTALREAGVVLLKEFEAAQPAPARRVAPEQESSNAGKSPSRSVEVEASKSSTNDAHTVEKVATIHVQELTPTPTNRAERLQAVLEKAGIVQTGEITSITDAQGIRHSSFLVHYRTDQPTIAQVHQTLTNAAHNYPGIRVEEREQDTVDRQRAAAQAPLQPVPVTRKKEESIVPELSRVPMIVIEAPQFAKESASLPTREATSTTTGQAVGREIAGYVVVQEPAMHPLAPSNTVYAAAIQETLAGRGALASLPPGERPYATNEGVQENRVHFSFRQDQPEAAALSKTLDQLARQPGIRVVDYEVDQAARRQQLYEAQAVPVALLTIPERMQPLGQRQALVEVRGDQSLETALQIQLSLSQKGAQVSDIATVAQPFTQEPLRHLEVVYRVDHPHVVAISQTLDELSTRGDTTQVHEFNGVIHSRQHATQVVQQAHFEQLTDKQLTPDKYHDSTAREERTLPATKQTNSEDVTQSAEKIALVRVAEPLERAESETSKVTRIQQDLQQAGATVGEIRSSEKGSQRYSEIPILYNTGQPQIERVSQTLDKVGQQMGVTVEESPSDRAERRQAAQFATVPSRVKEAEIER
ncbi:toprim domain-containing protein [Hymenobacter defluvii]|uniref:Toprim domain-containing protein n=1 Tax=Hymenobacter defluvii TaxID=2054411 RepID=A0ABS3TF14_9BACT|nr:toprim domain-containing protein [Hymenobacter defluvii]MBO3272255.1 toprim domain-containing protein [Hymenobacter defluvii]